MWFSGCYGIVEVPEGEWYCAKCADFIAHSQYNGNNGDVGEVREIPRCKLCPFGHGALKRTDNDGQCCGSLDRVIFIYISIILSKHYKYVILSSLILLTNMWKGYRVISQFSTHSSLGAIFNVVAKSFL